MEKIQPEMPVVMPVDDEHARMMEYARSPEGAAKIAAAQAEIDAGKGIVADDSYFARLMERLARRRAAEPSEHA